MKKELKKGYRLTLEEEAILRGEIPGGGSPPENTPGSPEENKKSTAGQRTMRAVGPLAVALALMIGLAYFFFYLVGGNKDGGKTAESAVDSLYVAVSRRFDAYRFPPLQDNERAVFVRKLALAADEEAAFWPEFYRFADRFGQAEAIREAWTVELAAGDYAIARPARVMQQYEALYKTQAHLVDTYSARFSDLLSPERMPWVFILHDRIDRQREERRDSAPVDPLPALD